MDVDLSELVPVIALLACGVASVALAPRNRAARILAVLGGLAVVSVVLTPAATADVTPSVLASLQRYAVVATYLPAVALLSVLQMVYPDGRFERPWHRRTAGALVALAVAAPLVTLFGHDTLSADGTARTEVRNVLALPGLAPLGRLAQVVIESEPLWFFLGFVVLVLRFRDADREGRRELWPILGGLLALSLFLLPVVVETVGGPEPPQPAFELLFRAALTVLPVVLLVGISRRTRLLAGDLQASRARLATAEDAERRRIERDLHDGVQQQLVALLSLTALASRQARSGSAALQETLTDVHDQLTDAVDGLRELVYGIRPPVLEDSGVVAALESRLSRLPAALRLDLGEAAARRWPAQTEAAAYFVACEAVTNALKHAPGAAVEVRLRPEGSGLRLEVEDDGPGLEGVFGGGLTGLRDRVDSTGGAFSVRPGRRGGTLVEAVFT